MKDAVFERSVVLPVPAAEAFAWHERPDALQRLTPPWERVEVLEVTKGIREGSRVTLRAKVGPVWTRWRLEHGKYVAGREFNDRQRTGPFEKWEHRHLFQDLGDGTSRLTDTIRYRLPFGILGRLFGGVFTRRKLERMFAYRHAVTRDALADRPAQF